MFKIPMFKIKTSKLTTAIVLGVSSLLLSSCDTIRSTLGLDHYQADAFNTPTNPPLTLPPDYNLKPPVPGAAPTNAQEADAKAKQTLNVTQGQAYTGTASEKGLMNKLPTTTMAPENIRDLVDREAEEESTLSGKLSKQAKSWKAQAKENFYSLSGDKSKGSADGKDGDKEGDKKDNASDDDETPETEVDKLKHKTDKNGPASKDPPPTK